MVKIRPNHERKKGLSGTFFIVKMIIIGLILAVLAWGLSSTFTDLLTNQNMSSTHTNNEVILPDGSSGAIVHHEFYSLSYVEKYELPEWISYISTANQLRNRHVKREKKFSEDPQIRSRSAMHKDYIRSGYTRGHLVPAGDMSFDKTAMKETFFMSNICPQLKNFNNGIWKELEELVRDWTFDNQEIVVVTGPILENIDEFIGKNNVGVPKSFYKIILDISPPSVKAIAFLIPHKVSYQRLQEYVVTIDEVEEVTGLDFFDTMYEDSFEEILESSKDASQWEFNEHKFHLRINKWNKE